MVKLVKAELHDEEDAPRWAQERAQMVGLDGETTDKLWQVARRSAKLLGEDKPDGLFNTLLNGAVAKAAEKWN